MSYLGVELKQTHVQQGFGRLSRSKQWLQAIVLLQTALKTSIRLDEAGYNAVASACNSPWGLRAAWRVALRNLCHLRQLGMEVDVFSFGIGAVTCAMLADSQGFWGRACCLLQSAQAANIRLSLVAWGSLLDTSSKASRWRDTASLLQSMHCGAGPEPDTHCFNMVISATSRCLSKSWQLGLEMFSTAASSVGADEVSFNSALVLFEGSRSADGIWSLISMMRRAKIQPTQVTYGTTSRVFSTCSLWRGAVGSLSMGAFTGVAPNVVAFGAALDSCQRSGEWTFGCELLQRICATQLQTSAPAVGAAITAAGNCQQWSHTLALLKKARGMSILTSAPAIGAAMSACEGATEDVDLAATNLWQQVLGLFQLGALIGVDLPMLGSAVSACSKGQQWERGLFVLAFGRALCIEPGLVVVNSALDGMDRVGRWAEATSLLESISGTVVQLDSLGLRSTMQAAEAGHSPVQTPGSIRQLVTHPAVFDLVHRP